MWWTVGNDIYGASVYVAAGQATIDELRNAIDLETESCTGDTELIAEQF